MKINHKVHTIENDTLKLVRTDEYEFSALNPNTLLIKRNGVEKLIKVANDHEFTFKVMKTMIKAKDGAEGLVKFLADSFWESTAVKIMDFAMDNMKPAKV